MKTFLKIILMWGLIATTYAEIYCHTPNNEPAKCIPLTKCPKLLNAFKNLTSETKKFLQESQCGYTTGPLVCCGSETTYGKTEPINFNNHTNINLLPEENCGYSEYNKLFYGTNAQIREIKWSALLEYQKNGTNTGQHCGGMLINVRYILTAAHCIVGRFQELYGDPYRVRLGDFNRNTKSDCEEIGNEPEYCYDNHQDYEIEEMIIHPNYNATNYHNDIALLRLKTNVTRSDFINPICLPTKKLNVKLDEIFKVSGWAISETDDGVPNKLIGLIQAPSDQICDDFNNITLSETQICVGNRMSNATCNGDTGGALAVKVKGFYFAMGIESARLSDCNDPNGVPVLYTVIWNHMTWILDNLKPF